MQKCVGKVLIQIQQKSLLKDAEGEHCIIKRPKLMERSIDEEDDDGYDKDIVNSGLYRTSGAIKFSFKKQCIVFLNNIIMMGYAQYDNKPLYESSDIWHQTELPYRKFPGLHRNLMPSSVSSG